MNTVYRRFLISISIAFALHLTILILLAVFSNRLVPEEYKPLTVQISLDNTENKKAETLNKKKIKKPEPAKTFKNEESQAADIRAEASTEVVKRKAAQNTDTQEIDKTREQQWKPDADKNSYVAEEPDDNFIDSILSNSTKEEIDAESLFGDDRTKPADTKKNTSSGSQRESGIDRSTTTVDKTEKAPKGGEIQSEESILDDSYFEKFDENISSSGSTGNTEEQPAKNETIKGGGAPGTSISFDDPSNKRKLIYSPPPEIPEDIKRNGKPKYIVVMDFIIDSDGFISNPVFRKASTDPRIDAAVSKILRSWVFEESKENGQKKVRATLTYIIEIK